MKWCAYVIFYAMSVSLFAAGKGDFATSTDKGVVVLDPYTIEASPLRRARIHWKTKHILWGGITEVEFMEIESGSIPDKAGIKSGDRLLSINGQPVKGMKERDMLRALFRGTATILEVQSSDTKGPRKTEVKFPEMKYGKER